MCLFVSQCVVRCIYKSILDSFYFRALILTTSFTYACQLCSIGNPHQVGQQPITYYRQVLALCDLPATQGVDHPKVYEMFPRDVVERAKEYRAIVGPSGTGAYTHSQGILGLRKHIAEYIQNRDGYRAYPGNIFLTNGASAGIGMVLQGLLANNNDAVMIPIPQYPSTYYLFCCVLFSLYSVCFAMNGCVACIYCFAVNNLELIFFPL